MRTHTLITMTLLLAAMAAADQAEAQLHGQASASAAATAGSRMQAGPRPDAASPAGPSSEGSLDAEAVLRGTAELGLPQEPVRRTVAEGRAKGASEDEVARAALRTRARLLVAREALERDGERVASSQEISLGAEALLRGTTRVDLERIGDAASGGPSLEGSLQAAALGSGAGVLGGAAQVGAGLAGSIGIGIVP